MTEENNNEQLSYVMPKGVAKGIITTLIAGIIALLLYHFLPFGNNPNKGLAILAFVAILWFTEALHITVTALIVPILAATCAIPDMTTKTALASFANPIIYIFFGGFALATALHIQKLDRKIALWLISLSRGSMFIATLLIFAVTAFLSMWISNTATAAMMLPLAFGIMGNLDPKRDHKTFVFVLLGIAYSASIGGLGTLVGSPPNAIASRALGLDFAQWMAYGLPLMIVLLPMMVIALYIILRPQFRAEHSMSVEEDESIPWTRPRVIAMILFIVTALAWIFSSKLKVWFGLTSQDTVIALIAAVLVVILGLATWKQVDQNTDWGVLLLFGGGIALSNLLELSGASQVLGELMAGGFTHAHPFLVILGISVFIIILTEFTSNTASAALLVPVFASVASEMGMPKEVLVMVIGLGASCAFMLPVATPPNAIVFGTGYVAQRDMMRVGAVLNAMCIIIISLWAYFFLM